MTIFSTGMFINRGELLKKHLNRPVFIKPSYNAGKNLDENYYFRKIPSK